MNNMEIEVNEYQGNSFFVPNLKPKTIIEMPSPLILGRSLHRSSNDNKCGVVNIEVNQKDNKGMCMINYNKVPIFKKIMNKRKV